MRTGGCATDCCGLGLAGGREARFVSASAGRVAKGPLSEPRMAKPVIAQHSDPATMKTDKKRSGFRFTKSQATNVARLSKKRSFIADLPTTKDLVILKP